MQARNNEASKGTGAFVGRREARAALRGAAEAALGGRGRLILVAGEAGMGKTRLVEVFTEDALELGARVLWGSCWEGTQSPSLWPWRQLVRASARSLKREALVTEIGPDADELARISPEVAASEALHVDRSDQPGDPEQMRFRFFESFAALLATVARREPVVVIIEDLHWADESSLLLLRFLAPEMKQQRVLLVGTYRYPDIDRTSPLATHLTTLTRLGDVVTISGFDKSDVSRLVADEIGNEPDDALVSALHERSGGNPFVVKESIRMLIRQDRLELAQRDPRAALGIPPTVRELILGRLLTLTQGCRDLLAQASVAGRQFDVDLLEAVTEKGRGAIAEFLEEGSRAGIVSPVHGRAGRFEFVHALMRETLYDAIPASPRAVMHGRYGVAIERLFAQRLDPWLGQVAHHFFMEAAGGRSEKASEYQERAGRRALDLFAYEEAAGHFERALDCMAHVDSDERRVDLLLALGDARMRAGAWSDAVEAYEEAAAAARRRGSVEELARAALGLGAGLSGFEVRMFDGRQIDLLSEALAALGDDFPELRAFILARLSVALSFVEDERRRLGMAEQAVEVARRVGSPRALASALAAHCDTVAGPAHTEQRASESREISDLARAAGDRELELLGLRLRFVALLESGDIGAAENAARDFETIATDLRQPLYLWYVPLWKGLFALMRGRLDDCDHWMETAAATGIRANSSNADALVKSQRLNWLLESGRTAEAHALIEEYDPARFPSSWGWRAGVFAAAGSRAEARAILDRLAAREFAEIPDDSEWLASMCMAAFASIAVDHTASATQIYSRVLPYEDRFAVDGIGAACLGSVALYLGRLAHLQRLRDEAVDHFETALAQNRRAGATLLVAHTLRHYGAVLMDLDDRALGQQVLDEARAIFHDLSLAHWAERTGSERASVPASHAHDGASVFRRDGEVWSLSYEGKSARVRDAKGLRDLAYLLARPGNEVHVLDLVATSEGRGGASRQARTDTAAHLDAQARAAYTRRLAELEEELNEAEAFADEARGQRARAERDALTQQLAAAYGLGGRPRSVPDAAERARSAVTWRIRAALGRIEKVLPELGRHLRHSVNTGMFCSYSPEKPIAWEL